MKAENLYHTGIVVDDLESDDELARQRGRLYVD